MAAAGRNGGWKEDEGGLGEMGWVEGGCGGEKQQRDRAAAGTRERR